MNDNSKPTGFLDVPVEDDSLEELLQKVVDGDVLGKILAMGAPGRELGMLLDEFARRIREYAVLIMEKDEYAEFDHSVRALQEESGAAVTPYNMLELFRIATLYYAIWNKNADGSPIAEAMETADKRVWGDIEAEETSDEGD